MPGWAAPGKAFVTPHELATPSRKWRTPIVPVVVVKLGPGVGATVSTVEEIVIGCGALGREGKYPRAGAGPARVAHRQSEVDRQRAGGVAGDAEKERRVFVPLPPSAGRLG